MIPEDREGFIQLAADAVLERLVVAAGRTFTAPVGVSSRHVHLTGGDLATLFGSGARLTVARPLRQPGQFAAVETVTLIGPGGVIDGARVVGPVRAKTVVEIGAADCYALGLAGNIPAGELFGVALAGPAGVIRVPDGGMVSRRHLHASTGEARALGISDGMIVKAVAGVSGRRTVFEDILVRVAVDMALELHLDRDEANACGLVTGDAAEIIVAGTSALTGISVPKEKGKRLVTEADVLTAYKVGRRPDIAGALLTPGARDALGRLFPGYLEE